jgi:hypothetical protein
VETGVPDLLFLAAGVEPRGELWAAMLDTKESWDGLVRSHAPDEQTRDAILGNPLYQNITGKFVQSHDYIAMERLYEIHSSGRYDLISVDTTTKVVPWSSRRRATACERSTKPSYMVWNRWKNSPMSSRNCEPRMRSAIESKGFEA